MASIFTKIINGEIPSYKIAENENFIAILDAFPVAKGHVLVIPKKEINKIFDMDKQHYTDLMAFAYDVAQSLEKSVPCKRVGMAVVGLEVPHVHVHLIPLNSMRDMNFSNPKLQLGEVEMNEIAAKIKSNL